MEFLVRGPFGGLSLVFDLRSAHHSRALVEGRSGGLVVVPTKNRVRNRVEIDAAILAELPVADPVANAHSDRRPENHRRGVRKRGRMTMVRSRRWTRSPGHSRIIVDG